MTNYMYSVKHIIATFSPLIYDKFCLYIFVEQTLYLLLIVYRSAMLCKLLYTYFYEHVIDDRGDESLFSFVYFWKPSSSFFFMFTTTHTHTHIFHNQKRLWQYCNLHRMICVVMLCIVIFCSDEGSIYI